jgi:uracil-DNA glycosylase
MSIQFTDDKLPTELSEAESYICLFPSIGLKECGKYENELRALYDQYPFTDYYKQHASDLSNRGKPGTYIKYPPRADQPGILNLYVKVYPGTKAYPNDNSFLRIKNFSEIFKNLAEAQGISSLHLDIPSKVPSERQEYMVCLEDYITTCKLHDREPTIYIHGAAIEKKEQVVTKAKPKIKVSKQPAAKSQIRAQATAAAVAVAPSYKLDHNTDAEGVILYEVDFVQISTDICNTDNGVLQYFPVGWPLIVNDTKLIQEAIKVKIKLQGVIGEDNVFPSPDDIFNAFKYLKEKPKVVILGQDPYHAPGQAHGLAFSVQDGVKIPPSLRNIYNALENDDVEFKRPKHGCLTKWAEQGIIMLNASLTVEQKNPKSHLSIWTPFTDRLVQLLSIKYPGLIFVLWGGDAKKKQTLIQGNTHVILEFNHPSPAYPNNTFGTQCKHFSQINEHLLKKNKTPIDWMLDA